MYLHNAHRSTVSDPILLGVRTRSGRQFHTRVYDPASSVQELHGGVGQLESLRKPLWVNRATYERARSNLAFTPMSERIDPAQRAVWFRTKQGFDIPYWSHPEYKDRDPMAPKSGLIYQPYWMTNKSRARLVQRPQLWLKPKSEVLFHPGTDEEDGLGKGFNPVKAITRAVHFTPTSFQPKKILGAIGSITATTLTGGLGPIIAPKVFSANSDTMKKVGMATTAIAVVAGAVVLGPAIAATLGPALSSAAGLAGKAVTGLTGFMGAFNKLSAPKQQQLAGQLTARQIADIEAGRAFLTESGVVYPPPPGPQQPPGSLMDQGQPVPMPESHAFGPSYSQPVQEAGMLGGLTPVTIGLMIGIPLVVQLLLKRRD